MSYRPFNHKLFITLFCLLSVLSLSALAQTPTQVKDDVPTVDPTAPIFVTVRVFQLSVPQGKYKGLNDQVFRVTTESHGDETKWMATLKKLYPEFTPSVLSTTPSRVFRTSKPQIIRFGQMGFSSLEVVLNGAQSPGDGVKPGTSLITEVNYNEGTVQTVKPIVASIQSLEVESGKTYFFASPSLKLNSEKYVGFLRQKAPAALFAKEEVFLAFAFSVDLDKRSQTAQLFNERASVALQNDAVKKVQPVMPEALKQTGLTGKIQVNVEITPNGKVAKAITYKSDFPEMNEYAVAAARQWEFAPTLFAENKLPISGLLTFEFPAAPSK